MKNREIEDKQKNDTEKLFTDFSNHMKNSEAIYRDKNIQLIADLLKESKFKDYASAFFVGGYMAAFEDLKRIGKINLTPQS